MLKLKALSILTDKSNLAGLPPGKILINTINAHSYNTAQKDVLFAQALLQGDVLIPDGYSVVWACRWLNAVSQPSKRITGWDLFCYEMDNANNHPGSKVMFLGSSEQVLSLVKQRASVDYPNLSVVTYSPPFKKDFDETDNIELVSAVNRENPDLLWIGMTAPKQEKWVFSQWGELNIHCHVGTIGAVFDFYAGTTKRAPLWWQNHGLEWLYRLLKEPKRMWRRYLIGNALFIWNVLKEKYQ